MKKKRGFIFYVVIIIVAGLFLIARLHLGNMRRLTHGAVSRTSIPGDFMVELDTAPSSPVAGLPTVLYFSFKDSQGKPLRGISAVHDRLFHVVIVSRDLNNFAHVHPEDLGPLTSALIDSARFPIRYTFPEAGRYLIGLDFLIGDKPFTRTFLVDIAGEPAMGAPRRDLSRQKIFDGYDVRLACEPGKIKAGEPVTLTYYFRKNGKPVTDLQPFLSTPMHASIVSIGLDTFMHRRGEVPGMPRSPEKFGPTVRVHLDFPAPGLYDIFGEVMRNGKICVTSFQVQAE